jgi:bombesin receptor subtype-3
MDFEGFANLSLVMYQKVNGNDNSLGLDTVGNVSIDTYTPYNERPETYIIPIVFGIIFIVGILGNGTLVLIFLRHRNMRNIPNT